MIASIQSAKQCLLVITVNLEPQRNSTFNNRKLSACPLSGCSVNTTAQRIQLTAARSHEKRQQNKTSGIIHETHPVIKHNFIQHLYEVE